MPRNLWAAVIATVSSLSLYGAPNFSTFISSSQINSVLSQNSTIGIAYAGNKFVGSVYYGTNNNQLYQTDLNGGNLAKFGAPIPNASGEVVLGSSLNLGGFSAGEIYAGSETNGQIWHFSNGGGSPTLFATVPTGHVRQISFDTQGGFGGDMIVTTNVGDIYRVSSGGSVTLVKSLFTDTEGIDFAPSNWGPYAGQMLVASENTSSVNLISNTGAVTFVASIPSAETVSFVPVNLGSSGNPLEGFYVANYPVDVQKAAASDFMGLQGDAIVTTEFGSNSAVYSIHYTGSAFAVSLMSGRLPNQSEDGIFVTAERIQTFTPEPSTWTMLGGGIAALAFLARRRGKVA